MLGWSVYARSERPDRVFVEINEAASAREQALAAQLLTEAYAVLRSPEFEANLRGLAPRYPSLYAARGKAEISLSRAADIVAARPLGVRYAPPEVYLVGGHDARDPTREHASAGEGADYGAFSGMMLGRAVLDQYASDDVVARSCAINVAAHEYAHTISTTPFFYTYAFTDTRGDEPRIPDRPPGAQSPVGSYLVGAVAQCTWLQKVGRIGRSGLTACIDTFGVRAFNWARCRAFGPDEPVAPKPDLPPPAPPL